jgi:hypothetical protein
MTPAKASRLRMLGAASRSRVGRIGASSRSFVRAATGLATAGLAAADDELAGDAEVTAEEENAEGELARL